MFSISPFLQLVITGITAVVGAIAMGSVGAPPGVNPVSWTFVHDWCDYLVKWTAVLSPILPAFSSAKAGPLAKKPDPDTLKALALFVLLGAALVILSPGAAFAATVGTKIVFAPVAWIGLAMGVLFLLMGGVVLLAAANTPTDSQKYGSTIVGLVAFGGGLTAVSGWVILSIAFG